MSYRVDLTKGALKSLQGMPASDRDRVLAALDGLASEPRPFGAIKMAGEDTYRLRSGDYRAVYEIDDNEAVVRVVKVGHRREVYR